MKELVIISGKGGTGKTSVAASFAILANRPVIADCDVDASDLHLILKPKIVRREQLAGGKKARIKSGHCVACGKCEELCNFDAIFFDGPGNGRVDRTFRIDPIGCEGCGVCVRFCAENAIEFNTVISGEWMISGHPEWPDGSRETWCCGGELRQAGLTVRREAQRIAEEQARPVIIVDGPPGIGCPVIASVTGASLVLVVTEPTLSGEHDLRRVLS